jgi:integrase
MAIDPRSHAGRRPNSRRVGWLFENWPATDRAAFEAARRSGSLLDDDGEATSWRPATVKSVLGANGRWLAYLNDHGGLDREAGPSDRMTVTAIRAYVVHLQARCASVTVASYIAVLAMMVRAMAPARDWGRLNAVQVRLQRAAKPTRDKRSRIVSSADLQQLGFELMAQADAATAGEERGAMPGPARKPTRDFRDGLIIALLASCQLRESNFLGTRIDRNLVRSGGGHDLCFSAEEMKHPRPFEVPVPAFLVAALERYRDHYRPMLLSMGRLWNTSPGFREPGAHLWISQKGMPLSTAGLQKVLARHTKPRFGHIVNVHLFRDCAVTTVAKEDPDHIRMCARLLGHTGLQTTERHCIVADTGVAVRAYHAAIEGIRGKNRRPPRDRRRSFVEPEE